MSKKKDLVEANGEHQPADAQGAPAGAPAPEVASGNGNGEAKRPPAHVVRIGRIKTTIWVNFTREGRPFYSTVATRVYRTVDGEYANATSFDRGDLLPLAEALRLAFLWIASNPLSSNGEDDTPF